MMSVYSQFAFAGLLILCAGASADEWDPARAYSGGRIYGITQTRDNCLCLGTDRRLVRFSLLSDGSGVLWARADLDNGRADKDGLMRVVTSARIFRAYGRFSMSLANMVVMADPSQPVRSSPPTLIQFQQVLADGVGLQLAKTVSVPAHHVRTTIRFTRLNLAFPERARFRYRLSGLEDNWSEPTSVNEASYTNLSPGPYQFEVQAGNINGGWDTPPAELALYVEPAWWQPVWLQACFGVAICAIGFVAYRARLRTVEHQWKLRFQERPDERTRIARELNDKLLQSFHGLILRFQAVREMLPQAPEAAGDALQSAIDRSVTAITEARDAVQALRGEEEEEDFSGVLANIAREFRLDTESPRETQYRVLIEGLPRPLHPVVRDGLYRIAREAVGNAFRHARPTQIELDIRYDKGNFRLRVRDDGCGIDPRVLTSGRRHHGLPGMRERATSIGGQFDIWSELCRGTEIEITIAGTIAYPRFEATGNSFTERRGEL